MFIRSERLFLRPGWPEEWQELCALMADHAAADAASAPQGALQASQCSLMAAKADPRLPHFFITVPTADGARLIGGIGLSRRTAAGGDAELGYWIAPRSRGQGYATEAVRALLGVARVLGHRRIVSDDVADNAASMRVLQKAGFRPVGGVSRNLSCDDAAQLRYAITLEQPNDCGDDEPARRAA